LISSHVYPPGFIISYPGGGVAFLPEASCPTSIEAQHSVIDTGNNTVVGTIAVGVAPIAFGKFIIDPATAAVAVPVSGVAVPPETATINVGATRQLTATWWVWIIIGMLTAGVLIYFLVIRRRRGVI